ncbi:MAG: hypothetical protein ACKO3W_15120 [bacterium]
MKQICLSSKLVSSLCLSALGLSSSASASVVTGVYLGYGANEQWGCAYKASLTWDSTSSVSYSSLRLSERRWDLGDGNTTITWCAQVYQGVTVGNSYTFDVVSMDLVPQTPPAPGPMGYAKAAIMTDAMSRWLGADSRVIAGAGNANPAAAAFNALAWELINENFNTTDLATIVSRMSLQTGAFRSVLAGEALSIYNAMVASLGQGGFQTTNTEGWLSPTAQDQIRMAPVPAPGVLALAGLSGLGLRRRRR